MNHHRRPGLRATGIAVATTASLAVAGLAGTSYASGSGAAPSAAVTTVRAPRATGGQDLDFVDVTDPGRAAQPRAQRSATAAPSVAPATERPNASGRVRDINSATGTVRWLGQLNGFLSPASDLAPRRIALDFVRHNLALVGLAPADVKTFHLHRDYTDITGTHHLYFEQRIGGSVLARNGLTASVNRAGHLLALGGSPHSTAARTAAPTQPATITTPDEALARTRGTAVPGADLSQDTATRMVFDTGTALRPAWETVVTSTDDPATTVIDAVTGEVLLRRPLTNYEHSTGRVFNYFPGARRGGHQVTVDFTKKHWLKANAHRLSGNNSHTFSDINDNNHVSPSEEVHPLRGSAWSYRLKAFRTTVAGAGKFCGNPWPCSWDPNTRFSWRVNRAQNATQVFYYVNKWHDHLKASPIGFTEAAGNFQLNNPSKKGKGGDPVNTQTDDGANTNRGLPDGAHIDNANMSTPPDGHQPTMQMFLQHFPHTRYPSGDPFSPTNVGDEADTVYHEYTHGLSNRLNVDVQGRSTLGGVQAGAMGEAWSDWYAMDYLVDQHLAADRPGKADVRLFPYDGVGVKFDRTEPIDCKVGQKVAICNGGNLPRGGYTYADYGRIIGFPEVHADGEIWAQTLWSLRARLGSKKTESLVTRAMEMAAFNPSFIDMRNAILVADQSRNGGADQVAIWKVFASRGMGWSANSNGGNDTTPVASFDLPPAGVLTLR